jgi:hypothetical protein
MDNSIDVKLYRSESTRIIGGVLTFFFVLIFIVGIQGLNGGIHGSSAIKAVSFVVMLIAVLGVIWSLFWFAQMAVITSDQGIVVKNWFRRVFIPWDDVKGFRFGNTIDDLSIREQFNSPYLQSYVVMNDGRHLVLSGLTAIRINRAESRRRVQVLLDKLEGARLGYPRGK